MKKLEGRSSAGLLRNMIQATSEQRWKDLSFLTTLLAQGRFNET